MQTASNLKIRLEKVFEDKQAGMFAEVTTDAYSELVKK